jgi:4Fe-4S ferredoxin
MDIEGTGTIVHEWEFGDHRKVLKFHMENCIGCDLCRLICPTSCIELGPVAGIATGQLEGVPPILVDHEKCAYCGLCNAICPVHAFEFSTEPADYFSPEDLPRFFFAPFVDFVREGMHRSFDEPASSYLALPEGLTKPSEGKVVLRHEFLDKCDPMGCKGCLNICPTNCFWVPKKAQDILDRGKITFDEDFCIHCGACHNACPQRIIEVTRTSVEREYAPGVENQFWVKGWEANIKKLLDPSLFHDHKKAIVVAGTGEPQKPVEAEELTVEQVSPEILERLQHDNEIVQQFLTQTSVRYVIEFKKLDLLKKYLDKAFGTEN